MSIRSLTGVVTTPIGSMPNLYPSGIQELPPSQPTLYKNRIVTTKPNVNKDVTTVTHSTRTWFTTGRTLRRKLGDN